MKPKIHKGTFIARLWMFFFPKWVDATTFGSHIFTRSKSPAAWIIPHEMVHAEQFERDGIFKFLWVYLWVERGLPYRRKSYEVEAYAVSSPPKP